MDSISARSFDVLLDSCISAIQERDRTVEDCLRLHPGHREELEPLLRLVVHLGRARRLEAPSDFRQASVARVQQLVASRPRQSKSKDLSSGPLRELWRILSPVSRSLQRAPAAAAVMGALVILLLIGSGTVYASAGALPGDALYPVKITVEEARLAVSLNRVSRAERHLAFASRRLNEAAALMRENRSESIDRALSDYETHLASAVALLSDEGPLSADEQAKIAGVLAVNLNRGYRAKLSALLDRAPEDIRPRVELALTSSEAALEKALEVIDEPEWPVPPPSPIVTDTPTPSRSPSPTLPSEAPECWTIVPTAWPTSVPTAWPTGVPTAWPTSVPTAWPTGVPTAWPTSVPTAWPTYAPTTWSTEVPTAWPTGVPTAWPTGVPTAWPTGVPTAWPTSVPTAWPTGVPTAWPTSDPDAIPTAPSAWPTKPSGGGGDPPDK